MSQPRKVLEALLALLVCPGCRGELSCAPDLSWLDCPTCRLRYPIEGGVPQLTPEAARSLKARR